MMIVVASVYSCSFWETVGNLGTTGGYPTKEKRRARNLVEAAARLSRDYLCTVQERCYMMLSRCRSQPAARAVVVSEALSNMALLPPPTRRLVLASGRQVWRKLEVTSGREPYRFIEQDPRLTVTFSALNCKAHVCRCERCIRCLCVHRIPPLPPQLARQPKSTCPQPSLGVRTLEFRRVVSHVRFQLHPGGQCKKSIPARVTGQAEKEGSPFWLEAKGRTSHPSRSGTTNSSSLWGCTTKMPAANVAM